MSPQDSLPDDTGDHDPDGDAVRVGDQVITAEDVAEVLGVPRETARRKLAAFRERRGSGDPPADP